MSHLEPSYLRYIYDGLEKGDLHQDNAAALPEGLIGLYEAAFEENKPASERQKLLETFAIWALLKKEVSAQFVAEILEVPTQEIIDFIANYSSWFTSPESGKYQLYHERLKIYLIQKLSINAIRDLNTQLIRLLEIELAKKKGSEFENYALTFLCSHMQVEAFTIDNVLFANKLFEYATSSEYWHRQNEILGTYSFSRLAMESALAYFQQNDLNKAMLIHGKFIELSQLQRKKAIDLLHTFHYHSKEKVLQIVQDYRSSFYGEEEKYFLYLITFLFGVKNNKSLDQDIKNEYLKLILNYISNELLEVLKVWNKYIPETRVLDLCVYLNKNEIDGTFLFNHLLKIDLPEIMNKKWFSILESIQNPPIKPHIKLILLITQWDSFNKKELIKKKKSLLDSIYFISDQKIASEVLLKYLDFVIQTHLFDTNTISLINEVINKIENASSRNEFLVHYIDVLLKHNQPSFIESIIEQISTTYWKCLAYQKYFIQQQRLDKESIDYLLNLSLSISNESVRNESIKEVVSLFAKNEYEYLSRFAEKNISSFYWKSLAFLNLSKVVDATKNSEKAIRIAEEIPRDGVKSEAFVEIGLHFISTANLEEAENLVNKIPSNYWKSYVGSKLISQVDKEQRNHFTNFTKDLISKIDREDVRSEAYFNLVAATKLFISENDCLDLIQLIDSKTYEQAAFYQYSSVQKKESEWLSFSIHYLGSSGQLFTQQEKNSMLRSLTEDSNFSGNWKYMNTLLTYSAVKEKLLFLLNVLDNQSKIKKSQLIEIENAINQLINNSDRSECKFALLGIYIKHNLKAKILPLIDSILSPYWKVLAYIKMLETSNNERDKWINFVEATLPKIENQGFRDDLLFQYYSVILTSTENITEGILSRIQSKYWNIKSAISLFEFQLKSKIETKITFSNLLNYIVELDSIETKGEIILEIANICLKNSLKDEYDHLNNLQLTSICKDQIASNYIQNKLIQLTDENLLTGIKQITTFDIKMKLISKIIEFALTTERFNLIKEVLKYVEDSKSKLYLLKKLEVKINMGELAFKDVFKPLRSEIIITLIEGCNLNKLNLMHKASFLNMILNNEKMHARLYRQFILKEFLILNKKKITKFQIKRILSLDMKWAIDIKNQLPN
jgi:hypothetical protein